jgi:hypothetical protein
MTSFGMNSNIGNWTAGKIQKARSDFDGDSLASESLKGITMGFLLTPKLKLLAEKTIPSFDNEGVNNGERYQFEVVYGNHKLHCNDHKETHSDYKTFPEMILEFYSMQFNPNERTNISKVISYSHANIQHLIIYFHYYQKTSRRNDSTSNKYTLKRQVVGAATFITGRKSSNLLYFAIDESCLPTDAFKPLIKTFTEDEKDKEGYYLRHHDLGMLMIALIQCITFFITSSNKIVLEAIISDSQKAYFFYKKLLFKQVSSCNEDVEYFRIRHPKLSYNKEEHGIFWLVSTCYVHETCTKVLYAGKKNLKDTKSAIEFAQDKIFPQASIDKNIEMQFPYNQSLFNALVKSKQEIQVELHDDKFNRPRRSARGKITANFHQLQLILKKASDDGIVVEKGMNPKGFNSIGITSFPGNGQDCTSFQCLSSILCAQSQQTQIIRGLLSYIFKSLSSFDEKHADHFQFGNQKHKLQSLSEFQFDIAERIVAIKELFDDKENADFVKKHEHMEDITDMQETGVPSEYMQSMMQTMAELLHHPKYKPNKLEFRMIATLANITIEVYKANYQSCTKGYAWKFEKCKTFEPYQFFQKISTNNDEEVFL